MCAAKVDAYQRQHSTRAIFASKARPPCATPAFMLIHIKALPVCGVADWRSGEPRHR